MTDNNSDNRSGNGTVAHCDFGLEGLSDFHRPSVDISDRGVQMVNIATEAAANSKELGWSDLIKVLVGAMALAGGIYGARLKAAFDRFERLEADLVKNRGKAYGDIWKLTGSLNLFGPITQLDISGLSVQLTNWYFERGWVLTPESKRRYFLLQEFLGFLRLRSISVRRPADEFLFGSPSRTVDLLRERRKELLGIESRGDESSYSVEELGNCVNRWKSESPQTAEEERAESAWILLQLLLSAFRSGMVSELGSRKAHASDVK
ncbi:hypothetical protein EDE15_2276 [Edaphobacter aggregans]|uniref:Uncharacterized protein n=1 Tax=Edaphobacter aggregans TaxID=570835 RepID=A0A428MJ45_9BACT|nr:hypothetical protein [Edaphobacter aggregans]RSL16753.1 hypothetical protein EDE15_2276 [Edaphobacter aggregans]